MNFRVYFLRLAASHPAWRFFIGLIHSSIIIFLFFILYALNILQVEIAVGSVFLVPPIIILTYTFFLRRFANPTKLEELLKLKEEKDKEREIERAREKERKDKERESKERESKERDKEREIERAREKERKDKEEKEEEKRIKDNYLDIGLGHKFPKTIEKIRNPITDKRVIEINTKDGFFDYKNTKLGFCQNYTLKYMPTILHEIRKELIDEMIENEIKYYKWKKFIEKIYDPTVLPYKELKKRFHFHFAMSQLYAIYNELVLDIVFKKLIEYFLENGWTLSENEFKQNVPVVQEEVIYLHPPEK